MDQSVDVAYTIGDVIFFIAIFIKYIVYILNLILKLDLFDSRSWPPEGKMFSRKKGPTIDFYSGVIEKKKETSFN